MYRNKNFLLLIQGQTVSRIGSILFKLSITWFLLEKTHSPFLVALYASVESIIRSLFKQFAGVYIEKMDKVKVIWATDLINSLNIFLVYLVTIYCEINAYSLTTIFLLAIIKGITDAFFSPAIYSTIPLIVEPQEMEKAFAINQASYQSAGIVGILLGSVFISFFGIRITFLINAASYFYSYLSELFIKPDRVESNIGVQRKAMTLLKVYLATIRYLIQNKALLTHVAGGLLLTVSTAAIITPLQVTVYDASSRFTVNSFLHTSLTACIGSLFANMIISLGKKKDYSESLITFSSL